MSRIISSAPGKVVLSGEYVVLDGAPAVSMAVNRRAIVTLDAADDLSVRCEGLDGDTDLRLFDCVRHALGADAWCGAVCLDTRSFSDAETGIKYGIGSSAALAVALTRALARKDIDDVSLLQCALDAHLEFQQGGGSGVDVATSFAGGLIEFRMHAAPRRLNWPDGLHARLLWSGVAASTPARLARLSESEPSASRKALAAAAAELAGVWAAADAFRLLAAYHDYIRLLQQFDVDHRLGIFDAGHDALARLNSPSNTVYKPCGAGGGDAGIVFGTDLDAVRAFADLAVNHGFRELDVKLDQQGVLLGGGSL